MAIERIEELEAANKDLSQVAAKMMSERDVALAEARRWRRIALVMARAATESKVIFDNGIMAEAVSIVKRLNGGDYIEK